MTSVLSLASAVWTMPPLVMSLRAAHATTRIYLYNQQMCTQEPDVYPMMAFSTCHFDCTPSYQRSPQVCVCPAEWPQLGTPSAGIRRRWHEGHSHWRVGDEDALYMSCVPFLPFLSVHPSLYEYPVLSSIIHLGLFMGTMFLFTRILRSTCHVSM